MRPLNMSDAELLQWLLIQGERSGACLLWMHGTFPNGYGSVRYEHTRVYGERKNSMKHRLMWELGVEGDKFRPHLELEQCAHAGCVPLSDEEIAEFKASYPHKWLMLESIDKGMGAL